MHVSTGEVWILSKTDSFSQDDGKRYKHYYEAVQFQRQYLSNIIAWLRPLLLSLSF